MKLIRYFWADEKGTTSIEYGLLAMLIAVGIIAGVTAYTDSANEMYDGLSTTMEDATGG